MVVACCAVHTGAWTSHINVSSIVCQLLRVSVYVQRYLAWVRQLLPHALLDPQGREATLLSTHVLARVCARVPSSAQAVLIPACLARIPLLANVFVHMQL